MLFIKEIEVNHLRYLDGLKINIDDGKKRNLILTGRNGSGKTTLLDTVFAFLKKLAAGDYKQRDSYETSLTNSRKQFAKAQADRDERAMAKAQENVNFWSKYVDRLWGMLRVTFNADLDAVCKAIAEQRLIVAYYRDVRNPKFVEPTAPVKPNYKVGDIGTDKIDQFLNMLVDYKVQAALAKNEGQNEAAENINDWFSDFERMLQQLYDDPELRLEFNYQNYAFTIKTRNKAFRFTEMSAGYRAAIDIIADLVFKMQQQGRAVRTLDMEGIVLIDEVETHLHLELQKQILPLLTSFFPHVQFIVSTHSPFILNSLENAVAYDLENKESITNLTDYSYSTLVEGYFGVKVESSDLINRLNRFESLVNKKALSPEEKSIMRQLTKDFDAIPEAVAPMIKGRYLQIKNSILANSVKQ